MKKILLAFLFFVFATSSFAINVFAADNSFENSIKQDLLSLYLSYPEYIASFEKDTNNNIFIKFNSGNKVIYDDKINKSFEQKLVNADIQDSLEQIYPLSSVEKLSDENFDPGRMRPYSLLSEIYGRNISELNKNIINVSTGYQNYRFNKNNGAAASLKNTIRELTTYSGGKFNRFLFPGNGTYNYRFVRGTGRLSPHAYGIAIDINSDSRDYWKWSTRERGEQRILEYPREMVKIFENNNFIWGGKWGHFDTLHFEYRPEIIIKARYFSDINQDKNWLQDVDTENPLIQKGIKMLEELK